MKKFSKGLASSSSGYAAAALCLAEIFNFKEQYPGQISEIARMGSGSAARSLEGGAVEWIGAEEDIKHLEWNLIKMEEGIDEKIKLELSRKCIARQVSLSAFVLIYYAYSPNFYLSFLLFIY